MQPHTRSLIFALVRQARGMLAAVEIFLAEDDKVMQQKMQQKIEPIEDGNKRVRRIPKEK